MSVDINVIGSHKIRSIPGGEQVELKTFWQDQDAVVIFFRRWGCMLCRLWAKELSEIAPVLKKNNIKLVGIGVENAGSKEFLEGKFFDGELYHVDDISTYHTLGFKRFNVVSIITSLFWKQSREAIAKGRGMDFVSLDGSGVKHLTYNLQVLGSNPAMYQCVFRFTYVQLSDVLTMKENIVMLHISEKKFNDMCEVNPHLTVVDYDLVTPN
ncbi:Prostamide/prostaglandin F synthase [Papilio machaon]|uniref:Prostamide/prostaglandin F synthase n=1 Tax=Papilio machaon TaxID=76193 RepID=A0A0N0PDA8_PAPMA|nr:Prostamide/prostaglandin F synthase [Papilio machaon]